MNACESMGEYKEVKTLRFPNMVARVYIPNLTEQERSARMKQIHNAAEKLLKSTPGVCKTA